MGTRHQPYSESAENALIGAALLSSEALEILCTEVEPEDFHIQRNAVIATVLRKLRAGAVKIDVVTVGDELDRTGDLQRIGGLYKLIELQNACPASSTAANYARIILDYAVRRRLLSASQEISEQILENGEVGVDSLMERARQAFGSVEMPVLHGAKDPSVDEFLEGPVEYDWLVEGLLERGDRLLITAGEGTGKALALDTPIPSLKGWRTMADMSAGDFVFSADGSPVQIVAATETMYGHDCFRVKFSDGASIVADADHLWRTVGYTDRQHGRWNTQVSSTRDISQSLRARSGFTVNHLVENAGPLQYDAADLSIDPYAFGVWLGDGHTEGARLTNADPQIAELLSAAGHPVRRDSRKYGWTFSDGIRRGRGQLPSETFHGRLRVLGVLGKKFIPLEYLEGSVEQRVSLLQGLMDTDGTICGTPRTGRGGGAAQCELRLCNEQLASDALHLIWSLGIKATWRSAPAKIDGRVVGTQYCILFQTTFCPFRLDRKVQRWYPPRTHRSQVRYIVDVEPVESVPVRCIQVANSDGMYLAGQECIPTHNSTALRQIAVTCASGIHPFRFTPLSEGPLRVLVVDLENSEVQVRRKLRPLVEKARDACNGEFNPENLRIRIKTDGLDLMQRTDVRWLMERVEANRPDMLVIGPLYKLHAGDPVDEAPARHVSRTLDMVRHRYGCALLMEAHSPYATGQGGKRIGRPYGASLWSRWPEFGYAIVPNEDNPDEFFLDAWRGPRDERSWPQVLTKGGVWPWMEQGRHTPVAVASPPPIRDAPTDYGEYAEEDF